MEKRQTTDASGLLRQDVRWLGAHGLPTRRRSCPRAHAPTADSLDRHSSRSRSRDRGDTSTPNTPHQESGMDTLHKLDFLVTPGQLRYRFFEQAGGVCLSGHQPGPSLRTLGPVLVSWVVYR